MWENHIRLCAALIFLTIPIAIADFVLTKGKSGGWISLDLSGILTGAYGIVLVLHIVISSVVLKFTSYQRVGSVHGISGLLAIALFGVGVYLFFAWNDARDRKHYEETRAARAKLFTVITLTDWKYSPDVTNANAIIVSVTTSESGRFSCNAHGYEEGEYGEMVFHSDQVEQRQVEKGEHFMHVIPITWLKKEMPAHVEIALYLFADKTGSAGTDILKIYVPQPTRDDDGHYFYEVLPLPTQTSEVQIQNEIK